MIEQYRFGRMVVNGTAYERDLKIIRGRVVPSWWRREGHVLSLDDLADVLEAGPEVLVVGRGDPGYMVPADGLAEALAGRGVRLEEAPTAGAVELFNEYAAAGRDVAGVFHLTC